MPRASAMILAGGRARRLGGLPKPLIRVGGVSILDRLRAVCDALDLAPRLVIADTASGLEPAPVPVVRDLIDGGALGGLYTALATAPEDPVVVLAADMPFVSQALITALLDRLDDHDAVMPVDAAGRHPLCAAYRRRVASHLRTALDAGVRRILDATHALDTLEVTADDLATLGIDPFALTNVNTPGDIERAERHAAGLPPVPPSS